MKFTLSILTVTLLALSAAAQTTFTNGTKISALVNASTPLTGAEVVPVNQSGVTKITTVAQINNAPLTSIATASNYLFSVTVSNVASIAAASNAISTTVTANATASTTASNTLQNLIAANTARDTTASNSLQTQVTANATTAAAANLATSNAILGIANAAAAQATATGVTNGGAANFGLVTYAVASLGSVTNGATVTVPANLATIQNLTITATGSGTKTITLTLTNLAAGENFSLIINRTDALFMPTYNVVLPSGTINLNSGAATTVAIPPSKSLLVNFTCLGTSLSQVVMSASLQQ